MSFVLVQARLVPLVILFQVEGPLDAGFALRPVSEGSLGFHHGLGSSSVTRRWAGWESFFLNGFKLGIFQPSAQAGPPEITNAITATIGGSFHIMTSLLRASLN
jgi:hypothetical protein